MIEGEHYLAVANNKHNSFIVNSEIYKWNGVSFVSYQIIPTQGAFDWEYFNINEDSFLVVANYRSGSGEDYNLNSQIFKWNSINDSFELFQEIATNGATDWDFFEIDGDFYLVVANAYSGASYNIKSRVYKWNVEESEFDQILTIDTHGGRDWEYFTIENNFYLVVANLHNDESPIVESVVYKWDATEEFINSELSITTSAAVDWEHFSIGNEHFLAVANAYDGVTHNIGSVIYKILF